MNRFALVALSTALVTPLVSVAVAATDIDGGAGSTGYKFLQVPSDARSAAVAQATASGVGAVAAFMTNPADLADVARLQTAATHAEWLAAVRNEFVGIAAPALDGAFGVSFRTQSIGDIPLRGTHGPDGIAGIPTPTPSGTYGVYDAALSVGYARRYGEFAWGVGVKGMWEKIYLSSATALAMDVGLNWRRNDFRLGAAVRNVGLSSAMRDERTALPWDAQIGAGYDHAWNNTVVRGALDLRYAPDYNETLHAGIEAVFSRTLAARLGYRRTIGASSSTDGLTTGIGLAIGSIALDYAYIPIDTGLGSEHLFTVIFSP